MPYISKKQLKSIAYALEVANSVINYNAVVTYRGVKVEWRKITNNADVAILELYKRRKNEKDNLKESA